MPEQASLDSERGSATVWAAIAVASLFLVAGFLFYLGTASITRHRASAAADLAALAAAGHIQQGPESACRYASRVSELMRVQLNGCRFEHWDALVDVRAQLPGPAARFGFAGAHARAGPTDH